MLYLIRHGETAANANDPPILQGQSLNLSLNDNGRLQAEKTARFLEQKNVQKIYASPMKRAAETASIINKSGLTIKFVDDIVEACLGTWEGLTFPQIQQKYPVDYQWFIGDTGNRCYLGGESYAKVLDRITPFFKSLNLEENIVVVSHGIVNKAFLANKLGIPLSFAKNLPQDNCGINMISDSITINYVEHLGG
jgi:broad specificity phosphatase PhoE